MKHVSAKISELMTDIGTPSPVAEFANWLMTRDPVKAANYCEVLYDLFNERSTNALDGQPFNKFPSTNTRKGSRKAYGISKIKRGIT